MTNLSILKNRDITLPTKVHIVKAVVFFSSHVWMWESDNKKGWVVNNWCLWAFVLEKILESPLTVRRANQSILKEINPEYSLEGLMQKLQYSGHLMQWADSWEKTLMLGKIASRRRRREQQRTRWWDGITDAVARSKLWETVRDRETWHAALPGVAKRRPRLSNGTTTAFMPLQEAPPTSRKLLPPRPAPPQWRRREVRTQSPALFPMPLSQGGASSLQY